ncbi:MAG: hypothetical protein RLO50_13930 [Azospirillaceae bacterium]
MTDSTPARQREPFGGWLKGIFAAAAIMVVVGVLAGIGFVPISIDLADGRTLTALIAGLEPAGWVVAATALAFLALGLLRIAVFPVAGIALVWIGWLAYAGTIYIAASEPVFRVRGARVDPPGEVAALTPEQVAIVADIFIVQALVIGGFAFLLGALVTAYLLRSAQVRAVYRRG